MVRGMQARDAWSSFRPIYLLSKCLGTMPLSLGRSGRLGRDTRCLVFTLACLLICVLHALVTPHFAAGDAKTASTLATSEEAQPTLPAGNISDRLHVHRLAPKRQMAAMKAMNPLAVSFMSLGALVVGCVYVSKCLPCFFQDLHQADSLLSIVVRPCARVDFRLSLGLFIYFWVITTPVTSYYLCSSFLAVADWEFLWNLILALGNLVSLTTELQFITLALFLYFRFRSINKFLKSHITNSNKFSYFSISKMILSGNKTGLTLRQIELIHKSNMSLCDLMKDLNYIYQIQLLCSTGGSFIKILFNVYFAITASLNFSHSSKIILWSLYYVTRFLLTVIAASYTSHEALKTKNLVAHVKTRHQSPELKEELNLFLDHASTWTMKFSACGLFTVNTRLITSAIAAGTTYMVVMVQFRPSI